MRGYTDFTGFSNYGSEEVADPQAVRLLIMAKAKEQHLRAHCLAHSGAILDSSRRSKQNNIRLFSLYNRHQMSYLFAEYVQPSLFYRRGRRRWEL